MLRMKAPLSSEAMVVFLVLRLYPARAGFDANRFAGSLQPPVPQFVQTPGHAAPKRRSVRCDKNVRWFLLPRTGRASAFAPTTLPPFRWWRDRRRYRRRHRPGGKRDTEAW